MVKSHECEDTRKGRKDHVKINSVNELQEPCFVQFTEQKLRKRVNKSKIHSLMQDSFLERGFQKGN